jgi:hypothetical protein
MLMPLALSDSELDIVFAAARPLQVQDRDPFLRAVAERLSSLPHLGDGLVFQICREVQREHWDPPVGIEVAGPSAVLRKKVVPGATFLRSVSACPCVVTASFTASWPRCSGDTSMRRLRFRKIEEGLIDTPLAFADWMSWTAVAVDRTFVGRFLPLVHG